MAGQPIPEKIARQLMRNRAVRKQLTAVGRRVAARAQAISDAEGGTARIALVEGIRPKGRSYVNVTSDKPAEEYGTENTPRIRAIGRAAREGI